MSQEKEIKTFLINVLGNDAKMRKGVSEMHGRKEKINICLFST